MNRREVQVQVEIEGRTHELRATVFGQDRMPPPDRYGARLETVGMTAQGEELVSAVLYDRIAGLDLSCGPAVIR